jgi:formylmethanofuran dehydrogenase subunit B
MDENLILEVIKLCGKLNNQKEQNINTGKLENLTNCIDQHLIGKKVIIRTYSAGVHFGTLIEKANEEVILKNSRRLWYWETINKGISLSEVANHGVHSNSKICETIEILWLQAIEIIPCTIEAITSIEDKNVYKA